MSGRPKARAGEASGVSVSGPTFEEALAKLEEIVSRLESQELSLEEALSSFEEGKRLLDLCSARLERAEARIRVLLEGPDGKETLQPFQAREGTGGHEHE